LAESLRKYDLPDFAGTEWLHNPVGVDFLFYSREGDKGGERVLARWTLYVHHTFIQWEADDGLRTGQALAEDDGGYAHGIVRLETRLIEYHPSPDRTLVELARELVRNAPIGDEGRRELLLSHLDGGL
jgi:hypothetical protein